MEGDLEDEYGSGDMTFNNYVIMRHLVPFLDKSDVLTLRAVTPVSALTTSCHMRQLGTSTVTLSNDRQISRLVRDMKDGRRPLPFISYPLRLNRISARGIRNLMQLRDDIFQLSVLDSPGVAAFLDYFLLNGETKMATLLSSVGTNLQKLRLDCYGDYLIINLAPDFPTTFPSLRTLELKYDLPNMFRVGRNWALEIALRAPSLNNLIVTDNRKDPMLPSQLVNDLPELLFTCHRPLPPMLTMNVVVRPENSTSFQELTDRGYNRVKSLNLVFVPQLPNDFRLWDPLIQTFHDLLQLQKDLEDLSFDTFQDEEVDDANGPASRIRLPHLSKLKSLTLYFSSTEGTMVVPFVPGQFPLLTRVHIGINAGWFGDGCYPTVLTLHINFQEALIDLNRIFPELQTLVFYHSRPLHIMGSVLSQAGAKVEDLGIFPFGSVVSRQIYQKYLNEKLPNEVLPPAHFLAHFLRPKVHPTGSLTSGPELPPVLPNFPRLETFHVGVSTKAEIWDVSAQSRYGTIARMQRLRLYVLFPSSPKAGVKELAKFHDEVDYFCLTRRNPTQI